MNPGDEPSGLCVVRFVAALDPAAPPQELPLPRRLGGLGRAILALVFAAATQLGTVGAVELWTMPTPGTWFSVLFTVFIAALVAAAWFAFATAFRRARRERDASARWLRELGSVIAEDGRIVDRFVNLGDDGDVAAFEVTVEIAGSAAASAQWEPLAGLRKLLQPQLPGVGSRVLVWRAPGSPRLVVDVLDPTRVDD
ncbi:hypothetical protein [Leucobacter sp. OAMLP11]|uniref:hypothetical protein n=1 Tax=Leucobacter sp. OAMLP11 TaxID=1933286 RepID=UPI001182D7E9|nr:hypothetical protein [Leucobacter sp. OAMLP11]